MIELRIHGQAVDVAPDTKITLNFNSNIFGDISKITPSNSLTISLPKTPKNAKVFGAPSVVGGSSIAPYRRWNAELYVNGVAMVDTAYAVLLSVGESYEIALYWGVVTALSTLKDNGKTLADIVQVLKITYGGADWWNSGEGKVGMTTDGATSSNLINAVYESGIEDLRNNATVRAHVALLPSVRASWLWDNIVADNGLTIEKPSQFTQALSKLALPFTTKNVVETLPSFNVQFQKANIKKPNGASNYTGVSFYNLKDTPSANNLYTFEYSVVSRTIGNKMLYFDATVYKALNAHKCTIYAETKAKGISNLFLLKGKDNTWTELAKAYADNGKSASINSDFDLEQGDLICVFVEPGYGQSYSTEYVEMVVTPHTTETTAAMGGMINTRDNLPDISQLDFVKALCAMYGLWATLVDGVVHLVSFADLYAQAPIDWSHKLVGTGDGDAGKTTYTLADYAKRNILRYKDDDTVKVDASGALVVDNDNLDREKDMLTLPFSASDGNVIPHLKWKDDDSSTGEVEEQKVETRIMTLKESFGLNSHTASLSFDGLKFSQLIPQYYKYWQKIMRNPIVIEEKVQLSEIDIKMLDFRKPIYLSKYGAQFAIDKVQWSESEPSTVTLVKLPPAKDIGVELPYKVTTGVTFGTPMSLGTNDPNPSWAYLVSGAGDYFAENATLYFDEAKASTDLGIGFVAWTTEGGAVLSTDNPFVYDGSNGDMVIYANTQDEFVVE